MPAALVAALADKTDISVEEAEKRWKKSKAIAEQETGLNEGDGEDFWKYVTGVFRKAMGIGSITESAGSDKKTALLNLLFEGTPEKFMTVIRGCKYLVGAGKAKGHQDEGIFIVPGVVDRAVFKELATEAAAHGLTGKMTVYGERASYTGGSMRFHRLDEFAGTAAILEAASAEDVHAAAHEAATSHLNDLPHPSQAQLEAGNYAKGHLTLHGLQIAIENPKGSQRKGVDPDGKEWAVTMPYHYGYIKRTVAVDGDHVDCCIGDHPESELVFFVDQVDAATGKYDEPKVMLGTRNQKEARDLYVAGFSDGKGAKRLGAMTPMHISALKTWLQGDTTKPLSDAIMESAFTEPQLRIMAADTFDELASAFKSQWPGLFAINRLTNNYDGGNVGASTEKEGAMEKNIEPTEDVAIGDHLRSRWDNLAFVRRYEPLMGDYHCETVAEVVKRLEPNTKIWGFSDDENPGTKYFDGDGDDGHHFAVVGGRFICDPWMLEPEGRSVFDMEDPADAPIIKEIYGSNKNWTEITGPYTCTKDDDFVEGAKSQVRVEKAKTPYVKPEVEYDGKVYKVKSAKTEIPDFTAMDRLEVLMWLNRNTVAKGYSKAPSPLAGLAGVIKINGQ